MELFRLTYNRLIDWLRRGSEVVEAFFQNGDLRRYLLYILIANLAAMLLFVMMAR